MTLLDTQTNRRERICSLLDRLADVAPTQGGSTRASLYLDDEVNLNYALAVTDLLAWLGAVDLHEHTLAVCVTSEQAGYLLRLLSDLLARGANLVADWTREGLTPLQKQQHPFGAAVDLLRALDLRRLELLPHAAPVREIVAAVGLLSRREVSGERSYLLVYDHPSRSWQLPGGRAQSEDGSLRNTLLRELSEELGCGALVEPDDLTLFELGGPLPKRRLSPSYGVLSCTLFQTFVLRLKRELPLTGDWLRWISEREIRRYTTDDGQIISAPALLHILEQQPAILDALFAA